MSILEAGLPVAHRVQVKTLGQRLRRARELRGFGTRELATLASVSPTWVSKAEHDKRKDVEVEPVRKVARALGVRLDWLLTGELPMDVSEQPGPPDQYPERGRALQRLAGLLSPDVESSVRATIPGPERHPTELAWIAFATRVQREHDEGFGAEPAAPPRSRTGELERVPPVASAQRRKTGA
jgi:transcriptional regulator with XRE-family HTH domain